MHNRFPLFSDQSNLLYISETIIDKEFYSSMHSHPNLEVLFFIDGEGFVRSSEEKLKVSKHDIVIINANTMHYEDTNNLVHFYAIGINASEIFLHETFKKQIIHIRPEKNNGNEIELIYRMIYQEASLKVESSLDIITSLYKILQTLLSRTNPLFFYTKQTDKYSSVVASTMNIIDNYFYSDLKLEEIAARFSISVSYLCHQFKNETNTSLIDYKLNCQINEAKNLLRVTDMSMTQISSAIGFNSSSYFAKIFKLKTGMTPSQYRNNAKNKNYNISSTSTSSH